MSRPGRPPRSQQRLLTPEDEALWRSVAGSLEPVRKKERVHKPAERQSEIKDRNHQAQLSATLEKKLQKIAAKAEEPLGSPTPRPDRKPPPVAEFDRRQVRRLAKGRVEVEARLDLHGMRAAEAYGALRAFVLSCYARGQRNVLVITGKGSSAELRDRPFDLFDQSDRGVLKRSVPMWLAEPELRKVVVSFTQAHPRHGGEGALYVQLRSRRHSGKHD